MLGAFAGAAVALLGLAWDVTVHASQPALAAHEAPLDPLSPAHDLIALGIAAAAACSAWAIWGLFGRRLGALALVPVMASVGWLGVALLDPPALPTGTAEQQAQADRLWTTTRDATARYRSLEAAHADGYVAVNEFADPLVHYVNPAYMHDGLILDPGHVESLVYENSLRGPVLVAAMYSLEDATATPPEIGGPALQWHRHDDLCFTLDGEIVGTAPGCPPGSATYHAPLMLHVWLVGNRNGRFATDLDAWTQLVTEFTG